jgi:acetyl-CoA carboxylase biotin carboxyl carrier protein
VATEVEAQITGNVWKIEKSVGDAVEADEVILILESMKMEIPVEAPCAGRIQAIRVQQGDSVDEGDVLVVLE